VVETRGISDWTAKEASFATGMDYPIDGGFFNLRG
jgi:hypothetical protein